MYDDDLFQTVKFEAVVTIDDKVPVTENRNLPLFHYNCENCKCQFQVTFITQILNVVETLQFYHSAEFLHNTECFIMIDKKLWLN